MKNTIVLCVSLSMLVSLGLQAETWSDPATGLTWRYTVVDGGVSLGLGSSDQNAVAVSGAIPHTLVTPSKIDGKTVVGIGDYAFCGMSSLQDVSVSARVVRIGVGAFQNCYNLVSVELPDMLTRIDQKAFYGCHSLIYLEFPTSLTYLGSSAFYDCRSLEYVYIPQKIKGLEDSAFQNCSSLLYVSLPPGFTGIGSHSFYGCASLAFVALPDSLLNIGAGAFSGCSALSSFTVPKATFSIGPSAFYGCSGLTSVTLPKSVVSIGALAFSGANGLLRIYTAIGDSNRIKEMFAASGYNRTYGCYDYDATKISFVESETAGDVPSGPIIVDYVSSDVKEVSLTVTNVVVNYVVNSISPVKAVPASSDTGFVNVITEIVSGGAVSVPVTWAMNYPRYVELYGGDFTKSLMKESVKTRSNAHSLVWQDYVAGTDPTDPDSKFVASVTMVDGNPVVSWSPELSAEESAKRIYRILGKSRLQDADWEEVAKGHEADYNFFKVTVEMR